jgi:hypothetical protein
MKVYDTPLLIEFRKGEETCDVACPTSTYAEEIRYMNAEGWGVEAIDAFVFNNPPVRVFNARKNNRPK